MMRKQPIFLDVSEEDLIQYIAEQLKKQTLNKKSYTIDATPLIEQMQETAPIPSIKFTVEAYAKMMALVNGTTKEIAWHGLVEQLPETDPKKATYIIKDILGYPQTVTAATVVTDEEEYNKWICSLDNDTANSMKMQGHSHVNMGTTPSGTDTGYYDEMLAHIRSYYIFLIVNKSQSFYIRFYDVRHNTMFEFTEHHGIVLADGTDLADFTKTNVDMAKNYTPPTTGYYGGINYRDNAYAGTENHRYGYPLQDEKSQQPPTNKNKPPQTEFALSSTYRTSGAVTEMMGLGKPTVMFNTDDDTELLEKIALHLIKRYEFKQRQVAECLKLLTAAKAGEMLYIFPKPPKHKNRAAYDQVRAYDYGTQRPKDVTVPFYELEIILVTDKAA